VRSRLRRGYIAIAVMAAAISLVAISLTAPVVSTTVDFSIFNSSWNGTSDLAVMTYKVGKFAPSFQVETTGTEITISQLGFNRLDLNPRTAAMVVIGPTLPFTKVEGRIVGEFVRNGGILLVADDFGTANSLLTQMNATSRFSNKLVMDLAYEKQPEFSVCFDLKPDVLTDNVSTVLMNYPSSLVVNQSTTQVIARSSLASWLDTNGDRQHEWGETRGPFPVLAREQLGQGTIVLLSDPSVLINGMERYLNNSVFSENLINYITRDRSSVYFDEGHRDFFDPIALTMQITGEIPTSAKVALALLAFVFVMWVSTDMVDRALSWTAKKVKIVVMAILSLIRPAFPKKKAAEEGLFDNETIMKKAAKDHPEWNTSVLRYLLRERERHADVLQKGSLGDHEPHPAKNYNDEKDKTSIDKEVHAVP